jgi:energy-coupling factor transporter ATP-binding protein EcfA2
VPDDQPPSPASPRPAAPAARPALSVTGMSVSYGPVVAMHDATFTIAEGEAVAITGPNGNGKSSILMDVVGLAARRGTVEIFGSRAPSGDVMWTARQVSPPSLPPARWWPVKAAAPSTSVGRGCSLSSWLSTQSSADLGGP